MDTPSPSQPRPKASADSAPRRHPLIDEAAADLTAGRIDRRAFLRLACTLGLGLPAATGLVAGLLGGDGGIPAAQAQETRPPEAKRGGTLRVAMRVMEISDPAVYDWSEKANVARQIIEPLVRITTDNIAVPHLAEGWEASDDLKTWTLRLRRGVTWSNGDAFTADDVIANFTRWLNPATGSSNISRFSGLVTETDTGETDDAGKPILSRTMTEGALERVDDHTVRLHLSKPDLSIPESLADYPALIVHRDFDAQGGDFAQNPIGTGPFELVSHKVGETSVVRRRADGAYWDGDPYLDEIVFIDLGGDPAAELAAFASGQVDINYKTEVDQVDAFRTIPTLTVYETITAQTGVARMKVDTPPFDSIALRRAIQACIDAPRMMELAYRGRGAPGEDHHVAPIHPEYAPLPKRPQDHDKARALLAEAGYPQGIDLTIDCVASPVWEQNACKALADMLKPAGIRLSVNILPGGTYWDRWLTTPFGFTSWAHRSLGVQVLNLAYRSGVPWNETGYANPEFDRLLDEAMTLRDPDDRRRVMAQLQTMLQDDAIMVQPFWVSVFVTANRKVKNVGAQPALEMYFTKTWLER